MADNPQPEGPDGDDEPSTPSNFPAFLFGGGTPGQFDPSTFDFSQVDLSQMMQLLSSTGPINRNRRSSRLIASNSKSSCTRRRR